MKGPPSDSRSICWFRRDLRLSDHAALHQALKSSCAVYCVFVFDTDILDSLSNKQDRRVEFIWHSLFELNIRLQQHGSSIQVLYGKPEVLIPKLARELEVAAVYCNRDYEPAAIARDVRVAHALGQIAFHQFKDQVIFEQSEILNGSGEPYHVFTPYKNAWLKKLDDFYLRAYPVERYFSSLAQTTARTLPSLESMGFMQGAFDSRKMLSGAAGALTLFNDFLSRISIYRDARDYPAIKGVSYLSVHLRFGTISIRKLAAERGNSVGAQTWLSELIWREFYQMLLYHYPQLAYGHTFKPEFNDIAFTNDETKFVAWCEGRTGYPLIDAAMRQLNQTGYMHNRLRMVVASFLVKDLHIDWRWGERYFAEKLVDFDLAANNGGWQWAASTGCDAQPWFRIFNPITQSKKFDSAGKFIRRYVPELLHCAEKWIHTPWLMPLTEQQSSRLVIGQDYPLPIVDHALARMRALALYKNAGTSGRRGCS